MIHCPNCGAEEISKLSVSYRQRLPAFEADDVVQHRALSAQDADDPITDELAPPRKASYWVIFVACQAFIWVVALIGVSRWFMTIWASGWMIATVVLWVGAYRHNTKQWPEKMRDWNRTYLCQRCGTRFVADSNGE